MDGSYDDTGDLHRGITDEMSRLMFGAPPNTEDEGDSDCPGTDGSLTEMLDRCPSEAMSDRDRDMTYSEMTDSVNERNSDIAALSDFSDDSSILGVRKVLRRRVPYRGRRMLPAKGCAPAPRTPPVKARNRAEWWLFEEDSTRSHWTRWSYGSMMDYRDEMFIPIIRGWTDLRLRKDADPRLDRYYPKLVQSLQRTISLARRRRSVGSTELFNGTGLVNRETWGFFRPNGYFEIHDELTGLTSGGTFYPPRCGVMTLRPGQ